MNTGELKFTGTTGNPHFVTILKVDDKQDTVAPLISPS